MKAVFSIFLVYNVKQNLSHAWLLEPHALRKLTLYDFFLSIKHNLSHA